jgi:ribosomal protein S2
MTSRVVLGRDISAQKLNQSNYMRHGGNRTFNQNTEKPNFIYGEKKPDDTLDISKSYDNFGNNLTL